MSSIEESRGARARGGLTVEIEWKGGKVVGYKLSSAEARAVRMRINGEVKPVMEEKRP